jgi:hypothetical protein
VIDFKKKDFTTKLTQSTKVGKGRGLKIEDHEADGLKSWLRDLRGEVILFLILSCRVASR